MSCSAGAGTSATLALPPEERGANVSPLSIDGSGGGSGGGGEGSSTGAGSATASSAAAASDASRPPAAPARGEPRASGLSVTGSQSVANGPRASTEAESQPLNRSPTNDAPSALSAGSLHVLRVLGGDRTRGSDWEA